MSAVEAEFCDTASRIPVVKAEVLYEYDSKHRAVYLGVSSHKENGISSTPTNKPDQLWLLLNSAYAQYISRLGAYSVFYQFLVIQIRINKSP